MNAYKGLFIVMWIVLSTILAMGLGICLMVKGWGLEPHSWPWIVGITIVTACWSLLSATINVFITSK